VAQPCYELGRQAVLMLYAQMTRAKSAPRQMTLEHRLIVRESSSPPTLLE
jgi:DNA-binding LacI/PurR family transcriptional regulator